MSSPSNLPLPVVAPLSKLAAYSLAPKSPFCEDEAGIIVTLVEKGNEAVMDGWKMTRPMKQLWDLLRSYFKDEKPLDWTKVREILREANYEGLTASEGDDMVTTGGGNGEGGGGEQDAEADEARLKVLEKNRRQLGKEKRYEAREKESARPASAATTTVAKALETAKMTRRPFATAKVKGKEPLGKTTATPLSRQTPEDGSTPGALRPTAIPSSARTPAPPSDRQPSAVLQTAKLPKAPLRQSCNAVAGPSRHIVPPASLATRDSSSRSRVAAAVATGKPAGDVRLVPNPCDGCLKVPVTCKITETGRPRAACDHCRFRKAKCSLTVEAEEVPRGRSLSRGGVKGKKRQASESPERELGKKARATSVTSTRASSRTPPSRVQTPADQGPTEPADRKFKALEASKQVQGEDIEEMKSELKAMKKLNAELRRLCGAVHKKSAWVEAKQVGQDANIAMVLERLEKLENRDDLRGERCQVTSETPGAYVGKPRGKLNATPAGAIYGGDSLLRASVAARSLPGSQTSSHSPLASVPPCPIPAPPPTHDPTARDDFEDPVNWALDRHGNLRDSSHMDWINDPHDEDVALPPAPDEEPLPLPALSETSRSPAANPAPPELPPTWEE